MPSGAVTDRPALHDALEFARSGDTLIVWKLDRLARSMKQLIETIENLRVRGSALRLTRAATSAIYMLRSFKGRNEAGEARINPSVDP
jgi:DNA invertase Pin-like site-specific DNA recombinase